MFVETIHSDREEWEQWNARLRPAEDPPQGLLLTVAWEVGPGRVGQINVWETPDSVSDNYVERVQHVVAELGEPREKPKRHGAPLAFYVRPS